MEARGGAVRTGTAVRSINLRAAELSPGPEQGAGAGVDEVASLTLADGSEVVADVYVSAAPVDVFKRLLPGAWRALPFFRQIEELEGIPVINVQLWFDRKLRSSVDGLCFSRSPLLSVYADMSTACKVAAQACKSVCRHRHHNHRSATGRRCCDDRAAFFLSFFLCPP